MGPPPLLQRVPTGWNWRIQAAIGWSWLELAGNYWKWPGPAGTGAEGASRVTHSMRPQNRLINIRMRGLCSTWCLP